MQGARYLPTFAPPLRSRSDHAPLGGAANAVRLRSRYLVSKGFEELVLVPSKGLEPPHRCRYMDLNHARLPIPPRWQSELQGSGGPEAAVSGRLTFLFLQPAISLSNHDCSCRRPTPESRRPKPALPQLRRHRNLRVQHLRHRTALLRRLRILLKCRRIRSRNLPYHVDVARCNRPARIKLLHSQRHVGADALRRQIRAAQLRRKRHRKARRVRRRNQLLRIRPGPVLESRNKRILRIFQHSAWRRNRSLPVLQSTLPHCASLAFHRVLLIMPRKLNPSSL